MHTKIGIIVTNAINITVMYATILTIMFFISLKEYIFSQSHNTFLLPQLDPLV